MVKVKSSQLNEEEGGESRIKMNEVPHNIRPPLELEFATGNRV